MASETPRSMLDDISTRWPLIHDPAKFVLRYAPAIEGYLMALVRDAEVVEEIRQEFLLRILERGFVSPEQLHGRFRHYLKVAVRNSALTYLRKKRPRGFSDQDLDSLTKEDDSENAQREWLQGWGQCVLARAWDSLETHQRNAAGNFAYTVLRLSVDHPDDDSEQLAERASAEVKKAMRADAFRKQLSRARRLFAQFLVQEIVQTLNNPTPERIEEELRDCGVLKLVAKFLPEDWQKEAAGDDSV